MGTTYRVYDGYYEVYVTDKQLDKPYTLVYVATTKSELSAYLMDVDDHIFVDIDIYDGCDCNGVFRAENGKIKQVGFLNDFDEITWEDEK
jgi:hypothetical protein